MHMYIFTDVYSVICQHLLIIRVISFHPVQGLYLMSRKALVIMGPGFTQSPRQLFVHDQELTAPNAWQVLGKGNLKLLSDSLK